MDRIPDMSALERAIAGGERDGKVLERRAQGDEEFGRVPLAERQTGKIPELAAPYGRPKPAQGALTDTPPRWARDKIAAANANNVEPLRKRAASVAQAVDDLELQVATTQRQNNELRARLEQAETANAHLRSDVRTYKDQADAANQRAETERMRRVRLQTILAGVGNSIADGLNEDVDR